MDFYNPFTPSFFMVGKNTICVTFDGPYDLHMPDGWSERQDIGYSEYEYLLHVSKNDTENDVVNKLLGALNVIHRVTSDYTQRYDYSAIQNVNLYRKCFDCFADNPDDCYVPDIHAYEGAIVVFVKIPPTDSAPPEYQPYAQECGWWAHCIRTDHEMPANIKSKLFGIHDFWKNIHDQYYSKYGERCQMAKSVEDYVSARCSGWFSPMMEACGHVVVVSCDVPPDVKLPQGWDMPYSSCYLNQCVRYIEVGEDDTAETVTKKVQEATEELKNVEEQYNSTYERELKIADEIVCKYANNNRFVHIEDAGRTIIISFCCCDKNMRIPDGWVLLGGEECIWMLVVSPDHTYEEVDKRVSKAFKEALETIGGKNNKRNDKRYKIAQSVIEQLYSYKNERPIDRIYVVTSGAFSDCYHIAGVFKCFMTAEDWVRQNIAAQKQYCQEHGETYCGAAYAIEEYAIGVYSSYKYVNGYKACVDPQSEEVVSVEPSGYIDHCTKYDETAYGTVEINGNKVVWSYGVTEEDAINNAKNIASLMAR